MNIKNIVKNILNVGVFSVALMLGHQSFGQAPPPLFPFVGGIHIIPSNAEIVEFIADNDATNVGDFFGRTENLEFKIGKDGTSIPRTSGLLIKPRHVTFGKTVHAPQGFTYNGYMYITGTVVVDNNIKADKVRNFYDSKFDRLVATNTLKTNEVIADRLSVKVTSFPDYVFAQAYDLMPLEQVEAHIKRHHHLPKVPSATQVLKEGMDVGQMNVLLMEKVEELTLYAIAKQKQIEQAQKLLKELKARKKAQSKK